MLVHDGLLVGCRDQVKVPARSGSDNETATHTESVHSSMARVVALKKGSYSAGLTRSAGATLPSTNVMNGSVLSQP